MKHYEMSARDGRTSAWESANHFARCCARRRLNGLLHATHMLHSNAVGFDRFSLYLCLIVIIIYIILMVGASIDWF